MFSPSIYLGMLMQVSFKDALNKKMASLQAANPKWHRGFNSPGGSKNLHPTQIRLET